LWSGHPCPPRTNKKNVIPLVTIIYLDKTSKDIELLDSFSVTILVIVNPETQVDYFENKGNKNMSNEQLMQEELKKAMGSVNEVATDELSDEELEAVAGGQWVRLAGRWVWRQPLPSCAFNSALKGSGPPPLPRPR
jgi:hypothetical protein